MSEYQKLKLLFPKEEEKKREFREIPIVFVEQDNMGEQEITLVIET